ncbi:family 16 glycosylhydrolase [Methylobacterium sp. J-077]|uniref:glycoside hydrolase family 16 protein n=1 Tax=Methylobacterium sp. J-077 TaxID=2836656 RepID=UPI001FBB9F0B|nr:glycoside hydrolase family 16 protein [Methylobacterium sp. J-077]MCJ2125921.1 glycoside hydrolase family 16 protein [Methylobacterium sp. J-077]
MILNKRIFTATLSIVTIVAGLALLSGMPSLTLSAPSRDAAAAPSPSAGLTLVFADEFDGSSVDRTKWYVGGKPNSDGGQWGGAHFVGPNEPQFASVYHVGDGVLTITAHHDVAYQDPERWGRKWYSGHLSAGFRDGRTSVAQRQGYFEARMKFPDVPGAWPGFWLLNVASIDQTKQPITVEEDVVEAYGHDVNSYVFTQHAWRVPRGSPGDAQVQVRQLPNTSADFHTYGARITSTEIIVYFDGVEKGRVPLAAATGVDPFFPLLDLAISQDWPVTIPSSGTMTMQVDYVHVYAAP